MRYDGHLWLHTASALFAATMLGFGPSIPLPTLPSSITSPLDDLKGAVLDTLADTLGNAFYSYYLEKAKNEGKLVKDPKQVNFVNQVFEKIKQAAKQSEEYGKTAKKWEKLEKWEIHVIEDDSEVNAFGWPGGKVMVYTGLIKFIANQEAEMAAVLGHEVVHALERHFTERISKDVLNALLAAGFAKGVAVNIEELDPKVVAGVLAALGGGIYVGIDRPTARKHELQADSEGLRLAAMAGYDPDEAKVFWNHLLEEGGAGKKSVYLSGHPGVAERLTVMNDNLPEFRNVYTQSKNQ